MPTSKQRRTLSKSNPSTGRSRDSRKSRSDGTSQFAFGRPPYIINRKTQTRTGTRASKEREVNKWICRRNPTRCNGNKQRKRLHKPWGNKQGAAAASHRTNAARGLGRKVVGRALQRYNRTGRSPHLTILNNPVLQPTSMKHAHTRRHPPSHLKRANL